MHIPCHPCRNTHIFPQNTYTDTNKPRSIHTDTHRNTETYTVPDTCRDGHTAMHTHTHTYSYQHRNTCRHIHRYTDPYTGTYHDTPISTRIHLVIGHIFFFTFFHTFANNRINSLRLYLYDSWFLNKIYIFSLRAILFFIILRFLEKYIYTQLWEHVMSLMTRWGSILHSSCSIYWTCPCPLNS